MKLSYHRHCAIKITNCRLFVWNKYYSISFQALLTFSLDYGLFLFTLLGYTPGSVCKIYQVDKGFHCLVFVPPRTIPQP